MMDGKNEAGIRSKRVSAERKREQLHCDQDMQIARVALPYLSKDCIFNIVVRLPLESVIMSRFVCKMWYGIVNSPAFIQAHLESSEAGLIVMTPVCNSLPSHRTTFSVESKASELLSLPAHHWPLINPPSLNCIKFMEIRDGKSTLKEFNITCKGNVRVACNGLIILDNQMTRGGLVILNPITRLLQPMPLGTRASLYQESYGLAFCHSLGGYKLVHLFKDALGYIECEIMEIGHGKWRWRAVDGPTSGLFGWLGSQPVSAIGALHWLPKVDYNEHIVSLHVDDEKFAKTKLPSIGRIHDRIFEMGGFLGYVSHQDTNQMVVWMLRSMSHGEAWEKLYSIGTECRPKMVPLYSKGMHGEIVFKNDENELYTYDHRLEHMRKVEVNKEHLPLIRNCFPHVNSLMSWKTKVSE